MDLLPFELYPPILGYLDFQDLLSVRTVCRKLNLVVKDFKIRELYVYTARYLMWPSKGHWSHTGQPYDFSYSIHADAWSMFSSVMNFQFLKKLKCNDLHEFLNELKSLELLEIRFWYNRPKNEHMRLILPALKTIELKQTTAKFSLELETPKLKEVTLRVPIDCIKFNYPLAVTQLRTTSYDEKLAVFENLELLECRLDDQSPDFLTNFPKLNVLKIPTKISAYRLAEFRRKRDELANLRLYYLGIEQLIGDELDNEREFSFERMSSDRHINRMPFYLKYYDLLDNNLPSCTELLYDDLLKKMPKIPGDFFRKFSNINSIKVSIKVDDPNGLLEFIGNCANLFELTLTATELSQTFYERLPSVSSLFILKMFKDPDLQLDFGFLARMKRLRTFETDQELQMTAELELDSFRYLRSLSFKTCGNTFVVRKSEAKGKYVLKSNVHQFPRHSSLGELLRWFDHIKKTAERSKKRVEAWKNGPQFKRSK